MTIAHKIQIFVLVVALVGLAIVLVRDLHKEIEFWQKKKLAQNETSSHKEII